MSTHNDMQIIEAISNELPGMKIGKRIGFRVTLSKILTFVLSASTVGYFFYVMLIYF